jgi:hypothetical protein
VPHVRKGLTVGQVRLEFGDAIAFAIGRQPLLVVSGEVAVVRTGGADEAYQFLAIFLAPAAAEEPQPIAQDASAE